MSENSKYQTLRAHLAFLRMAAAAEALPEALDHAIKAKLSHQDFLERLLAVEVASVDERRRMSLTRFASLPSPFTLADFDFSAQPSVDKKIIEGHVAFRRRRHQRVDDRAARCRQDHAGRRPRPRRGGGRDAHVLHDGGRSGGALSPRSAY